MKYIFLFVMMISFFHPAFGQVTFSEEGKPQVVYVYDPLCGWCYGFSPVMVRLAEEYKHLADFRVISGGMVRGDRVGPLSDIAPYIRKAYKDVERLSGVKFGEPYLEILFGQADWIMNSEPPSLIHALLVSEFPDRQTEVSGMIQRGIYQQALAPSSEELAIWVGEQFGKSREWILSNLNTSSTIALMNSQFDLSKQLGVTGFPDVLVWKQGQWVRVARGFTEYESLEQTIEKIVLGK